MENKLSISPSGEKFPLPKSETYPTEFDRIEKLAVKAKENQCFVKIKILGYCAVPYGQMQGRKHSHI